jgi:two-component system sensor histidine kinase/response regulator
MTGPQARILCADDVEDNRILVEETLADEGLAVVSCASGDALIEAFRQGGADLLLLDVRMPGRDGFETLAAVRELAGGAHVPALFLTAQRDLDTFDRALAAKAEFISKPIRPAELAGRVGTLLRLGALDAELRAHHDELARQRDAIMRLQLQHEMMSAFLVHDLKSPAGAIALHADVLRRDRRLPNDARESAEAIGVLARRMAHLARNILDLSRADEGRLQISREEVSLSELATVVSAASALPALERNVTILLEIAPDVCVLGDGDMLRRVLENLVENALRHAPTGSEVRVEGARVGSMVELRVCDAGRGVPAALHERIFERFAQLGSRDESRRGHGLGLPFCRVAADLHGGTITIDPERAGAVFVLRLPARGDA